MKHIVIGEPREDEYFQAFVANINVDGTNLTSKNCNGWSNGNNGETKLVGLGLATDEEYLAYNEIECGYQVLVYCIEQ